MTLLIALGNPSISWSVKLPNCLISRAISKAANTDSMLLLRSTFAFAYAGLSALIPLKTSSKSSYVSPGPFACIRSSATSRNSCMRGAPANLEVPAPSRKTVRLIQAPQSDRIILTNTRLVLLASIRLKVILPEDPIAGHTSLTPWASGYSEARPP